MHPILFELGNFPIYTYGFILAWAITIGLFLVFYLAEKRGLNGWDAVDIVLWGTVIGILGARFGYIIQRPAYFIEHWGEILNFRSGGITIIGAIIFGNITFVVLSKRYKIPTWLCLDINTAPILLGMAIGRIGCLMHGCCYGKICSASLWWAIHYPANSPLGDAPRHPSQIYELLLDLILMSACLWFFKRANFQGQVFWLGITGYAAIRFFTEFFRDSCLYGPFSLAQWFCLAAFVLALLGFLGVYGRPKLVSYPQADPDEQKT